MLRRDQFTSSFSCWSRSFSSLSLLTSSASSERLVSVSFKSFSRISCCTYWKRKRQIYCEGQPDKTESQNMLNCFITIKWFSYSPGRISQSPVTLRVQRWVHLWASVCHWDSLRNAAFGSLSLSVPSLTHTAAGKSGEEVRRRDFIMLWCYL